MRCRLIFAPLLLIATSAAAPQLRERSFMLTDFDRVRLDGPFAVEVTTGRPTGAVVAGDGRAADRVNLRVDGGTLVIGMSTMGWDSWRDDERGAIAIRVNARQLRGARINGGGRLRIDRAASQRIDLGVNGSGELVIADIAADQLVATLTGTGSIRLPAGTARTARFFTQGAGSINAGLRADDLTVQSQSAGDSRFSARLTASVNSLGSGAVRVEGPAVCRLSGTGPASCAGKTTRR